MVAVYADGCSDGKVVRGEGSRDEGDSDHNKGETKGCDSSDEVCEGAIELQRPSDEVGERWY
jgi:hypothetical protein